MENSFYLECFLWIFRCEKEKFVSDAYKRLTKNSIEFERFVDFMVRCQWYCLCFGAQNFMRTRTRVSAKEWYEIEEKCKERTDSMRVTFIWKSNTNDRIQTNGRTRYKTARDNKVTDSFMSVHDVLKQKCGENQPHCFSMASTREKGMCVAQISRNV